MGCSGRGPEGWYLGPGNWLLRLLGAKLLHGVIVFLLFLCHEDVFPSKVQFNVSFFKSKFSTHDCSTITLHLTSRPI